MKFQKKLVLILQKNISLPTCAAQMVAHYDLILLFLMMMVELILLLNIKDVSIMNLLLNLVEKKVFTNSNLMIIRKEDFALYMVLN